MVKDRQNGTTGAGFGVSRSKHHTPETRLNNRSGAHRARLDCNIEATFCKTVVPEFSPRPAQGEYFRVRRGVVQVARPVVGSRDHPPIFDHHGAHRNFLLVGGALGLAQSPAHEFNIIRIFGFGGTRLAHGLS